MLQITYLTTHIFLGLKIDRNRSNHSRRLSQRQYSLEMLSRYGMGDCKPVLTPMHPGLCLSRDHDHKTDKERTLM